MSNNTDFHEPVRLRAEFGVTEVRSAVEASAALRGAWPETRGKWYYAASRACSAAMEGRAPAHAARHTFIRAAQESRLFP
ncbi:DUF982 domain-containing protein [Aquamicrobium sp. LC103]|uniref:DUF982 domain-containing protein n=1 Tax=Aquamicrobium sp. LC103 TaxID=1120658 RepID=UPI00063E83FE|nr:DUF982 domain-containing protein [Aquamicrobium sp. LC103]